MISPYQRLKSLHCNIAGAAWIATFFATGSTQYSCTFVWICVCVFVLCAHECVLVCVSMLCATEQVGLLAIVFHNKIVRLRWTSKEFIDTAKWSLTNTETHTHTLTLTQTHTHTSTQQPTNYTHRWSQVLYTCEHTVAPPILHSIVVVLYLCTVVVVRFHVRECSNVMRLTTMTGHTNFFACVRTLRLFLSILFCIHNACCSDLYIHTYEHQVFFFLWYFQLMTTFTINTKYTDRICA